MVCHTVLVIQGVPVHIRPLPSGDMTVWHPRNSVIRAAVEPICRNRGYWKEGFYNWIIFRQFENEVLAELEAEAKGS